MSPPGDSLKAAVQRRPSFLQTLRAVGWSFFGVRRSADLEKDVNELNPIHLVIAGVLAAVVFIGVLLLIVNGVLRSGVAA